jgi:hypothetical protein
MTDQLISSETAKLAKEKGFPKHMLNHPSSNCSYCHGTGTIDTGSHIPSKCMYCGTCTQSLLQKWLREIHNIAVTAVRVQWRKYHKYFWELVDNNDNWYESRVGYKTYENALEHGLYNVLKLI